MTTRRTLASAAALATSTTLAASNDIGFNPIAANHYCEDLAESCQVLDGDRATYLARCIAEHRVSPPGGEDSDISPHAYVFRRPAWPPLPAGVQSGAVASGERVRIQR